ncbi:transcriptional regulator, MucR family [Palleronia marisminoris]|uniref:Transcriptional regulatory protein ros n=1 Tax=Palleronia marisminoris TaxID=315423 RepID=A0A1Y5RNP3_9RHOB|nr:MucR family transcriptional regulator [Palleronia marisminoris]SFG24874.1 transcriptional regulator, MucR family [Palleronia marisminoris]SLN19139.1 Transcriptional regulatory protein ros [Palleronia marisminoris]
MKTISQARLSDADIATIVAGYATRPDVSQDDIVALIRKLRIGAFAPSILSLTRAAPIANGQTRIPAVPVESAVTPDLVYCLCCGRGFKMLKRHLAAEHDLTEEEYRIAFGLPESTPLVAPRYSEQKAAYAREAGLGRHSRHQRDRDTETG